MWVVQKGPCSALHVRPFLDRCESHFHPCVHCKKRLTIFPSRAGMSLTKLSLAGNNVSIPGQESLVSDIQARDRKTANIFLQCGVRTRCASPCVFTNIANHTELYTYIFRKYIFRNYFLQKVRARSRKYRPVWSSSVFVQMPFHFFISFSRSLLLLLFLTMIIYWTADCMLYFGVPTITSAHSRTNMM